MVLYTFIECDGRVQGEVRCSKFNLQPDLLLTELSGVATPNMRGRVRVQCGIDPHDPVSRHVHRETWFGRRHELDQCAVC